MQIFDEYLTIYQINRQIFDTTYRKMAIPMSTEIFSIRKDEVVAINGMFSLIPIKVIYNYKNRLVSYRQTIINQTQNEPLFDVQCQIRVIV